MLTNLVIAIRLQGLKNYELAHAVKMSEADFSRELNGHGEFSPIQKKRIAEALDADLAWLFSPAIGIPRPVPEETERVLAHA